MPFTLTQSQSYLFINCFKTKGNTEFRSLWIIDPLLTKGHKFTFFSSVIFLLVVGCECWNIKIKVHFLTSTCQTTSSASWLFNCNKRACSLFYIKVLIFVW